jgi:hypothetical protein
MSAGSASDPRDPPLDAAGSERAGGGHAAGGQASTGQAASGSDQSGEETRRADPPALRASDADRERVIETLKRAAGEGRLDVDELDERLALVYSKRTLAELEALAADVVVVPTRAESHAASSTHGVVVRDGAPGGTRRVLSIMGGHEHKGRWRIARKCTVINIMGGTELDLTKAELSGDETRIGVLALMGGCEIRVPEGLDVQVSKLGIMGGNDVKLSDAQPQPGAPVIHIRLLSIMGGCSVIEGPKKTREQRRLQQQQRRAEKEQRRLERRQRDDDR